MTGQEYLDQLEHLEAMIKNKEIEKRQWRDIALGATAKYDGERVQSTGNQQKMSDAVIKLADIDREIDRIIDEKVDTRLKIIATIEKLPSMEYRVLHSIYIKKMSLKEAAADCNKSYGWAKNVHADAVRHLGRIINKK